MREQLSSLFGAAALIQRKGTAPKPAANVNKLSQEAIFLRARVVGLLFQMGYVLQKQAIHTGTAAQHRYEGTHVEMELAHTCKASPGHFALVGTVLVVLHASMDIPVNTRLADTCGASSVHFTLVAIALLALRVCVDLRAAMEFADTFETSPSHFTFVDISLAADTASLQLRAFVRSLVMEFADTSETSSRFTLVDIALAADTSLEALRARMDVPVVTELADT